MPRKVVNIIGQRFGRLVVLENTNQKAHGSTVHKCVCDCGNIILVPNSYLTGGHTKSCGCLSRETHTTHGKSDTRLYSIFSSMKRRCYLKTDLAYKDYGGRGITICDEWLDDFSTFYDWALSHGYTDNLTIDRIDVNGNYEPMNCRWIERGEQPKNTRRNIVISYCGETHILSDWSRKMGIPMTTLSRRYKQFNDLEIVFYKGDVRCKKNNLNKQKASK